MISSHNFQYSLRIVGFRDSIMRSIWRSSMYSFQYSLRIVGFRDVDVTGATHVLS